MDETKRLILWPHENVNDPDLPPEFCQYRDEGCELADSCLSCPFSHCLREEFNGNRKFIKQERTREMVDLYTGKEKNIKETADLFGVSARTLYRELKNVRAGKSTTAGRRRLKKFVSKMKRRTNKGGKRK